MRCLVVDIGNTSTTFARVVGERVSGVQRLPSGTATRARIEAAVGALAARGLDGAIVGSVVPRRVAVWRAAIRRVLGRAPLVLTHRLKLGVRIEYPKPASIGADRLANASGAVQRYGAPVIVADFGTALTFDVISADAAYVGGVIAPGLPFVTDYLAEKTALLPHIKLRGRYGRVGKSTTGAMRIGAKVGYRGMVREITAHLCEGGAAAGMSLCATGGFAAWALEGIELPFVIDPHLTLRGLGRIWELNS